MDLLFRAMTAHRDGMPLFVRTRRGLSDVSGIPINGNATLDPNLGGISVSAGSPENLPRHRRPPKHGGTGPDPIWELSPAELPRSLVYRADGRQPDIHGFLEPKETMSIWDFENGLLTTRRAWKRIEPDRSAPTRLVLEKNGSPRSISALDGAFQEPITVPALRDVVVLELKLQNRDAVQRKLELFRETLRGADRETDDDVVLEVLDFLAGWCLPHERI
ncbi:MAG TPA: hypothetical protein VG265_08160 [Gaiellaceae bacterium]|jgi:hypothetical protein|nr:hypothetical protein [Gaiellaceae bacterium]